MKYFLGLFILVFMGCKPQPEIDFFFDFKNGNYNPILVRTQDFGSYIEIHYFEVCKDYKSDYFDAVSKNGQVFLIRNLAKFQKSESRLKISCENQKLILSIKVVGQIIDTIPIDNIRVNGLKFDSSRFEPPVVLP